MLTWHILHHELKGGWFVCLFRLQCMLINPAIMIVVSSHELCFVKWSHHITHYTFVCILLYALRFMFLYIGVYLMVIRLLLSFVFVKRPHHMTSFKFCMFTVTCTEMIWCLQIKLYLMVIWLLLSVDKGSHLLLILCQG